MKIKTKLFLSILSILSVAFILGSCNKYEEGPSFSLLTKKMRITGTWKLEKVIDSDGSVEYPDEELKVTISKDGSISYDMGGFSISGTWDFIKDKEFIRLELSLFGETSIQEFQILKLKNKELWLKDDEGAEQHFVAK